MIISLLTHNNTVIIAARVHGMAASIMWNDIAA